MRTLDWRQVLTEHGVPYIDRGANVKRGELNIKCPMCGSADPSFHLGLNLESGFWACWRNREHRGKSPLRLLVALLRIPYWQARKVAGIADQDYVDPDGFDAVAARLMGRMGVQKVEHVKREFLQFDPEFKELGDSSSKRFYSYMQDERRFGPGTEALRWRYGLRYARRGFYKDRVILPYYMNGELVAWTARAIVKAEIRYLDLKRDDCLVPIKETLYNYDSAIEGGVVLVVVEGQLDALKIDVFGYEVGVHAVALSTNTVNEQQVYLLEEIAPLYKRVLVMMDTESELGVVDSMRMKQDLRSLPNLGIVPVPYKLKDAALMTPNQSARWADRIIMEV